ncbi:MAG: hypothetical protein ABI383_02500 [Acidobacteriaceae bacterium]
MMELDELREKWAELDQKLDVNIRLNREVLSAAKLNRTRSALQRLAVYLGLESVVWMAIIVALGNFIYAHVWTARFAVSAIAAGLYSIVMMVILIREIVAARQIDYERPITIIQKEIEALRVLRIRSIQWGVLAGLVAWVPFTIVIFKAVFGVDIYEAVWVWSTVGFGLACIPLAIWISKKFEGRMDGSPRLRGIMRSLAGYNLSRAAEFLGALSAFEEERRANEAV